MSFHLTDATIHTIYEVGVILKILQKKILKLKKI